MAKATYFMAGFVGGLICFIAGVFFPYDTGSDPTPMRTNDPVECPSEDSCRPVYVDGAWVIVEDPG